jgi:hypothetical protein
MNLSYSRRNSWRQKNNIENVAYDISTFTRYRSRSIVTCAAENGKSCVSGVKRGKARRKYPHFQFFFKLKLFTNLKSWSINKVNKPERVHFADTSPLVLSYRPCKTTSPLVRNECKIMAAEGKKSCHFFANLLSRAVSFYLPTDVEIYLTCVRIM